jgi:hypothetical protein
MRIPPKFTALFLVAYGIPAFAADCIPYTDAPKKVDENVCVTGKVVKVFIERAFRNTVHQFL